MLKKIAFLLSVGTFFCTAFAGNCSHIGYNDRRIGGSCLFEIGATNLNMDPIKKIVDHDIDKGGFNFNKDNFVTMGFTGYAGHRRNGLRLGWGVWGGYNTLYSNVWRTLDNEAVNGYVDSIIQLHNFFAHTGFVLEKSVCFFNTFSVFGGAMIGSGILGSVSDRRLSEGAFKTVWGSSDDGDYSYHYYSPDTVYNYSDQDSDYDNHSQVKVAIAPVMACDLHGGAMYSLTRWMHVGVDFSALIYYSSRGFGYQTGTFKTVNPGVRLRLIFGSSV